jgi:hypothetical protein
MRKLLFALALTFVIGALCPASVVYSAAKTTAPEPVKKFDKGNLYNLSGIKMLVLSGTFNEMGRQYGTLLGKEISALYDVAIDKAFIKSGLFSQEELDLFAKSIFKSMPSRQKELIRGISAASGLKQEKAVLAANLIMVQILARKKFGGNISSCTSAAIWGKYTVDGKVLTARDYDFPDLFRQMAKDYAVLVVFKPSDGSNAVGGICLAGAISFTDALNDKGIYIEGNNGSDSAGLIMFNSRTETTTQIMNILFDAEDSEGFNSMMNSTRFSYPFILMVADGLSVRYYEIATWDVHRRDAKNDTAIVAANQFSDPAWGILSLPSPAAWYSTYRESKLLSLAKGANTPVDEKHMMSILDIPFYNEDGSLSNKGVAVLKKDPKDDEVTVWQVITRPADLKMWVRLPTLTNWVFFDLKEWFK